MGGGEHHSLIDTFQSCLQIAPPPPPHRPQECHHRCRVARLSHQTLGQLDCLAPRYLQVLTTMEMGKVSSSIATLHIGIIC